MGVWSQSRVRQTFASTGGSDSWIVLAGSDIMVNERAGRAGMEPQLSETEARRQGCKGWDRHKDRFRIWHMQVQPQFSRAATPTFLFLYIALPVMKQCRDELMDLDLWNPLGQRAMAARDNHIAWKKYTEFMPRAQVALMEIPIYATYSLLSDLDALCERILTAEKRFREGPQKVIHTHRAA